jgi:hypothetical protein
MYYKGANWHRTQERPSATAQEGKNHARCNVAAVFLPHLSDSLGTTEKIVLLFSLVKKESLTNKRRHTFLLPITDHCRFISPLSSATLFNRGKMKCIRCIIQLLLLVPTCHAFMAPASLRPSSCQFSAVAEAPIDTESGVGTEQKIRNIAVIAHVDHGKTTL